MHVWTTEDMSSKLKLYTQNNKQAFNSWFTKYCVVY